MTINKLLRDISARLTPVSGDLATVDSETIICQSLNITRTQLYTDTSIIISDDDLSRINTIIERRLRGEPLPYIFGVAYFYDREFFVNTDVLIPRPDTETLVEEVLNREKYQSAKFVDIGTGSGILAAVLTAHRPAWSAVAVDISYRALRVAARNVAPSLEIAGGRGRPPLQNSFADTNVHHPSTNKNINLICSDMLTAIKPENQFDFIVSNPPYISSTRMKTLDDSVAGYEPHTALHGGDDGLDYYRMISGCAEMYLKDSGRVYLEIGYDQGESVPEIFVGGGWVDIAVIKDLAGRDRVVRASLP